MHRLIHALAMTVVLYHMLVGCCWHHAHLEASSGCQQHGHVAHTCCHEEENHHDEEYDHECPLTDPHRPDGGCNTGQCVFVVPQTGGTAVLVSHVAPLAAVCVDPAATNSVHVARSVLEAPPPTGSPPLRLHLMKQVLLI